MNINQIAFIICADNEQYYNECVRYINELEVPEHFTTDIICIQEADSMVQGYRAGMQASDAKYKVYLRQDVFILNRNFIPDLLNIFKKDEKIGLIGMAGCSKLRRMLTVWNVGMLEVWKYLMEELLQTISSCGSRKKSMSLLWLFRVQL